MNNRHFAPGSDYDIAPGSMFAFLCPCGEKPTVSDLQIGGPGPFMITCSSCYDGAPDAGKQLCGRGFSFGDAIDDWNLQVEESTMP